VSDPKAEIERIQNALAAADDAIVDALDARARATLELKQLREENADLYFTRPRDHDIVARLRERAQAFPAEQIGAVMSEVLSGCQRLVAPMEVAFVGQEGGFGHLAARKHFGGAAHLHAVPSSKDVLADVERGRVAFGVLPFETSYDGVVTETLDLLARSDARICAEIPVRRSFHLLSKSGEPERIEKIYASSSAITACTDYLARRFPDAIILDARNGFVAAEQAAADETAAALATDVVAERVELRSAERSIEDRADLQTRYVAVGNDLPPRTGVDRTALAVATNDAPGVLFDCLRPFADRKVNVYHLETRPARGWDYRYLVLFEVDGHVTDRSVLAAIEELRTANRFVKVLGSYPRQTEG
jgi:chorismate mutase/prephenate dehydratase